MPNTRIMMHQPAGGAMGSADEVNIQAAELNRTMKVRISAGAGKTCSALTFIVAPAVPACLASRPDLLMTPITVCDCTRMYAHDNTWMRPQVVHQFFVQFTGLSLETVQEETDRDNFLSPKQAAELGLIDGIL